MTTQTLAYEVQSESIKLKKYTLVVQQGPNQGLKRQFDRRLIYVGSSPDVALPLDDSTVSRHHLKIEGDKNGYRIRDLGSKNGTYVNGVRISDAYLADAAVIRIGASEVLFKTDEDTVEIELSTEPRFGKIIGQSAEMREIFALLSKVAPTNYTALVEGESGTGKELVAEAIHSHSRRRDKAFVVFDCSAVPADLIESELFGHVKGAFTGATASRTGAFEQAHGGTLFLDEIGELSLDLQPKLLRVLEKREIKPVGSNQMIPVDVRIVAATNRNLEKEVEGGGFREDLYYRLAVLKIHLPALRERREDIPLLVNHFLSSIQSELGLSETPQVSYETMAKLQNHPWPGNVRELKNFIERASLLAEGGRVETRFIAKKGLDGRADESERAVAVSSSGESSIEQFSIDFDLPFKDAKNRLIEKFEKAYWARMLDKHGGNISQTAREAGIHRKSLEYLLKKLAIHPRKIGDI
ncbi:MAG: sigma 54-dependent Fis family transcriptional regulator [Myxococcales bacterium]|nr:sigma 54-dependent Fis family transcriptional regulator [Myxococcales bacterium]